MKVTLDFLHQNINRFWVRMCDLGSKFCQELIIGLLKAVVANDRVKGHNKKYGAQYDLMKIKS